MTQEALVWDTGLSQIVARLEEDFIRWHSEERVKAKERQLKCLRAQKDLVIVEASVREAAAAQRLKGTEDDPWQDKIEGLVKMAKEQRDQMRQLADVIRGHAKQNAEQEGMAGILEKLPAEGAGLGIGAQCILPKQVRSLLDALEAQMSASASAAAARTTTTKGKEAAVAGSRRTKRRERRGGDRGGGGGDRGDRGDRGGRRARGGDRGGGRDARDLEDDSYSYDDDSRSPTPEPQRARRREGRQGGGGGGGRRGQGGGRARRTVREYSPSEDSYSDSRSDSYSRPPSRDHRRSHRGGHDRGGRGGGGGRRRRGGEDGGAKDRDVDADIDRFLRINKLDGRCEKLLREMAAPVARKVMGLSGNSSNTFELSGDIRDPTAIVMSRIRKAQEEAARGGGGGGGGGGGARGHDRYERRGGGGGGGGGGGRRDSRSRSRRGRRGDRRGGGPIDGGSVNAVPLGKARDFPAGPPTTDDLP